MSKQVIIYDLETTGLNYTKDKIIEMYFYNVSQQTCLHLLVNPGVVVPPETVKVHGLTNMDLKNKPKFKDVMDDIEDFVGENPYLISHNNIAFDKKFLLSEILRSGFEKPKNWKFIDTLHLARIAYPELSNYKQDTLREKLNISNKGNHRANKDVLDLVTIYEKIITTLETQLQKKLTIRDIYKMSKHFTYKKMPFGKYKNQKLEDVPQDYVVWLQQNVFASNRILRKSFKMILT